MTAYPIWLSRSRNICDIFLKLDLGVKICPSSFFPHYAQSTSVEKCPQFLFSITCRFLPRRSKHQLLWGKDIQCLPEKGYIPAIKLQNTITVFDPSVNEVLETINLGDARLGDNLNRQVSVIDVGARRVV